MRRAIELLVGPFDGLAPWASLALLAALTAVVMLVVVRRTSPQRTIRNARAQMAGAMFEMRLFLDQPRQLLAAQARLVGWTLVYVLCLVPSALVLAAPLGLLYLHLELRHGLGPLSAPSIVVVKIEAEQGVSPRDVELSGSPGARVTARVHAEDEHAVYARIAIERNGRFPLQVRAGSSATTVELDADADADVVSAEHRRGISQLWALGIEPPITASGIRAITIPYPERASPVGVPWWLYWLGLSTALAMALRRRFGVAL
ncbi:MAG: hypothetical protein AB7P03_11290 [Kofleriaceae bacterium]